MYLVYVDESGDTGLQNSPSDYFVLSGLVLYELTWQANLDQIISFRKRMRDSFGMKLREELHASEMITSPGELARIPKHQRLAIIQSAAREIASLQDISLINVIVSKQDKPHDYDVFESAWKALIQRFENTISHRNFPGPHNAEDKGLLIADRTDDKKLTQLIRKMRNFNPIPNQSNYGAGYRNMQLSKLIEDPNLRDSHNSLFIQMVDVASYLIRQSLEPNQYMRKKSGRNFYNLMDSAFCKVASSSDPNGFVRL